MKSVNNNRSGFTLLAFMSLSLVFDTFIFLTLSSAVMNLFVIITWNIVFVGACSFAIALLGQFLSSLKMSMPSTSLLSYLPEQWLTGLVEKITGYSAEPDDIKNSDFLIWLAAYSGPLHLSSHFFESLKVKGSKVVRQLVAFGYPVSKISEFIDIPDAILPIIEKSPKLYQSLNVSRFHQQVLRICCDLAQTENELLAIHSILLKITELSDQIAKLEEDSLKQISMFSLVEQALILKSLDNGKPPVLPKLKPFVELVKESNSVKAVQNIITMYKEIDDLNHVKSSESKVKEIFTKEQMRILHHLFELKSKKLDVSFVDQLGVFPTSDGMLSEKLEQAIPILGKKNCMVYASKSLLDTLCELDEAQIKEVTCFSEAQKRMLVCHFENYNAFLDIEGKEKCEQIISWVKEHKASSPAYLKLNQLSAFDLKVVREKMKNLHIRSFWQIMDYISHFIDRIQNQHIVSLFKMSFRKRHVSLSYDGEGQRLDVDDIHFIRSHELSPKVTGNRLESRNVYLGRLHESGGEHSNREDQWRSLINSTFSQDAHFGNFGEFGGENVYDLFEAEYSKRRYLAYSSISFEDSERVWNEASRLLLRHDFETQDLTQQNTLRSYAALRLIRCFAKNDDALGLALPYYQPYWHANSSMSNNFEKAKKAVIFLWKLAENYETISGEIISDFSENFKKSIIEYMSKDSGDCPNQLMNSIWHLGMPYFFSDVIREVSPKVVTDAIKSGVLGRGYQSRAEDLIEEVTLDGEIKGRKTILSESEFQRFTEEMIKAIGVHLASDDRPGVSASTVAKIEEKAEDYMTELANSYQQYGRF
jgi:hypothetical protein